MAENPKKESKGRKSKGFVAAILAEVNKGNKDLEAIAKKTGAKLSTVRTQFYRAGKSLGIKRGRKGTK